MVLTIATLAACGGLWLGVLRACGVSARGALIRSEFVGLAFLVLAYVGFPLTWSTGYGVPWAGLEPNGVLRITSVLLLGSAIAGVWVASQGAEARSRVVEERLYDFPLIQHARVAYAAVAAALLALLVLAIVRPFFFTGIGILVRRQGDQQGSGIGPLLAVVTVALWAALYADMSRRPIRYAAIVSGVVYLFSIFVTGQKSRFVIFALLVFVRAAKSATKIGGPRVVAALVAGIVVVAVTVTYQVQVRGGGFALPIEGVDRSDTAGEVQYAFNRFAQSTFDSTRTIDPVLRSDLPVVRFQPAPVWGAVVSPVPSALLPGKTTPPSRKFAQLFFPDKWAVGTGVPPSLGAEVTWYFGQVGAILIHFALFLGLTRLSLSTPPGMSVVQHGSRILMVPTVVMLLKGGSDGAVRFAFTLYVGLGVLWALSRVLGISLRPKSGGTPTEIAQVDVRIPRPGLEDRQGVLQ